MKFWVLSKAGYEKSAARKKSFFLLSYNRFQNGYASFYFRLYRWHLIIYTGEVIGKMKIGIRKHWQIKI